MAACGLTRERDTPRHSPRRVRAEKKLRPRCAIDRSAIDPVPQARRPETCEEAGGGRIVAGPAFVLVERGADLRGACGWRGCQDGVDQLADRHRPSTAFRKRMNAWCRCRRMQWPSTVPSNRLSAALPGSSGRPGCVRPRAWICDFSSTDRTTAWRGGAGYSPTMSASWAMNSGSRLRLKVRRRCGCSWSVSSDIADGALEDGF